MTPEAPYPHRLDKRAILAAFGDRVFMKPEPKVERQYLNLEPKLTQQALVPEDIAEQYDTVTFEEGFEGEHSWVRIKPLSIKLINQSSGDPVSLVLCKHMDKARDGSDRQWHRFKMCVVKGDLTQMSEAEIVRKLSAKGDLAEFGFGDSDVIADCIQQDVRDHFILPHRVVRPEYRGPQNETNEYLSNILLSASEQAAQKFTDRPKPQEAETGQLDVMLWFYNNGYNPKTPEDKDRFQKIIAADPGLCVTYGFFVFEKSKWDSGTIDINEAYEVTFTKTIQPSAAPQAPQEDSNAEKAARERDAGEAERIRRGLGE